MATAVHPPRHSTVAPGGREALTLRGFFGVFRYSRRALELVWSTNRFLTMALALLTLTAGVLPACVAYVGSLIVDAVVATMAQRLTRAKTKIETVEAEREEAQEQDAGEGETTEENEQGDE